MELKRRLSLVVAIMSVALGSGHLVQNVLVKPARSADVAPNSKPVDITLLAAGPESTVPEPAIKELPTPSFASTPNDEIPSIFTLPVDPVQRVDFGAQVPDTDVAANECMVSMDLAAQPSAMIGLTLTAPCQPNERVVVRHAGLAVTGKTTRAGTLFMSLPAFTSDAEVSVRFSDGQTISAEVAVPEAATLRRFGVQWLGDDAFQLNAFEGGAGYGERGHVSDADPQVPLAGQPQIGGFMSVLGNDRVELPMLAEVYTYPAEQDAPVRIVLEAAITERTCAREILGETLAAVDGDITITDLSLAMPDCAAVGDIMVLKNIDPDLKIAAAD